MTTKTTPAPVPNQVAHFWLGDARSAVINEENQAVCTYRPREAQGKEVRLVSEENGDTHIYLDGVHILSDREGGAFEGTTAAERAAYTHVMGREPLAEERVLMCNLRVSDLFYSHGDLELRCVERIDPPWERKGLTHPLTGDNLRMGVLKPVGRSAHSYEHDEQVWCIVRPA